MLPGIEIPEDLTQERLLLSLSFGISALVLLEVCPWDVKVLKTTDVDSCRKCVRC